MKNNNIIKNQNNPQYSAHADKGSRYQKSDQSPRFVKTCNNSNNPFDRNGTRRSLGADTAPQFDMTDYSLNGNGNSSTNFGSESSVSDFTDLSKPYTNKRPVQLRDLQTKSLESEKNKSVSKSAPASPTKPALPPRSPHTHVSMLNAFNVRTIGNKISISIKKKPNVGLGFTIVTRDNQVLYGSAADIANSVVILVNKILPNGGAAEDDRLRPGDRLLEVNGESVTSLKEATNKLRSIPENENVNLLISRVERVETPSHEQQYQPSIPNPSKRQITFDIPLNKNQKDRQQLGLNILRLDDTNKSSMGPGIYIHSILENSLASQQGGLKVDDKLIAINGKSLNDINVEDTIFKLKKIMQTDCNLSITVCRAVTIENQIINNETDNDDQNPPLLPNKVSQNRKVRQNSCARSMPYYNPNSSNDSLSYNNPSKDQPDLSSAFVRESKGRRSMSDKRKAHEDASQYQFYKETRVGNQHIPDDRLYCTLPTASRLKKMASNESPNKVPVPVKPSQIKQLNIPKSTPDPIVKTPNRSLSLRSSPTRINQLNRSHSPKRFSQTPTHDQQPGFNRAMNNSFKRAVQKSLPDNDQPVQIKNSTEKLHSTRKEAAIIQHQTPIENPYPIYSPPQNKTELQRSNSVKVPSKKKSFTFKNILTFIPNVTRTKATTPKEKSDTFPLTQQPRIHVSQGISNHLEDPVIIDSTKRVLEWQKKNEDVISKENKVKEQKIYQTVNTKGKADVILSVRNQSSNRNTFPINSGTTPYDTFDSALPSQAGLTKLKSTHASKSPRVNSHKSVGQASPKNGVLSHSNRVAYQSSHSVKVSRSNDIYATINKVSKKDPANIPPSAVPHPHINKYRF